LDPPSEGLGLQCTNCGFRDHTSIYQNPFPGDFANPYSTGVGSIGNALAPEIPGNAIYTNVDVGPNQYTMFGNPIGATVVPQAALGDSLEATATTTPHISRIATQDIMFSNLGGTAPVPTVLESPLPAYAIGTTTNAAPQVDRASHQAMIESVPQAAPRRRIGAQRNQPITGGPRFACPWPTCPATFGRKDDLRRHEVTVHTNPRTYSCTVVGCGKGFARKDKLKEHMRVRHGL